MKKTGLRGCALLLSLLFLLPAAVFGVAAEDYARQEFEALAAGSVPLEGDVFAEVPTHSAVVKEDENQFIRVPYVGSYTEKSDTANEVLTGNCGAALRLKHDALDKGGALVIEADYRPHSNKTASTFAEVLFTEYSFTTSTGKALQSDGQEMQLYKINLSDGALTLGSGGKRVAGVDGMVLDEWNTVQVVFYTSDASYEIYVNGALYGYQYNPKVTAFDGNKVSAFFNVRDVKLGKDSLVIVRCDKTSSFTETDLGGGTNYIDVDNVCIYGAREVTVTLDGEEKKVVTDIGLSLSNSDKKLLYAEVKNPNEPIYYTTDTTLTDIMDGAVINTCFVGLDTVDGVDSIRTEEPYGLRFLTAINKVDYDSLRANGAVKRFELGTVILPADSLPSDRLTGEELEKLTYLDVPVENDEWYDHEVRHSHVFAGNIVNIKKQNYNTPFLGVGYVRATMRDGSVLTVFAEDQKEDIATKTLAFAAHEEMMLNNDLDKATLDAFKEFAANAAMELEGLNVLAMGDSLFRGAQNENGYHQWINKLGRQYHWNLTNLGISGATISYQPSKNLGNASMYNLLFNHSEEYCYGSTADEMYYNVGNPSGVKADVDMILLQAGSNDYGKTAQAPLGTVGSTDPSTFLGAWKLVVDRLLVDYPNATVVMMTAWENGNQTRKDGAEAIPYTSSVVDLYEELYCDHPRVRLIDSGDPEVSNVHIRDAAWRKQYAFDSFHLTNEGMAIMANSMMPLLQEVALDRKLMKKTALEGLDVLAIGDSLFDGHSLAGGEQWLELLAKQCDWNLTNLGQNGWTVGYNPGAYKDPAQVRPSMYHYLMNDESYKFGTTSRGYSYGNPSGNAADVDLVFLEGGWNDYGWGIPLGTASDTDGSTYMGAVNAMVKKLLETYPNARVVLVTSWHRSDRMGFVADGMKAVVAANYEGNDRVVLIDAGDPDVSGVRMNDSAWASEYAMDAAHLNAKGMEVMAESMLELIWQDAIYRE
ncbi:MAG: SGNH/GDSL hydrolase family protein [Ruminococcaceae bacterium]|nr:SGNH/GDSL hydrolase family protein [Oscillospiraceae bacterium]